MGSSIFAQDLPWTVILLCSWDYWPVPQCPVYLLSCGVLADFMPPLALNSYPPNIHLLSKLGLQLCVTTCSF
jgi:hypothetical protein